MLDFDKYVARHGEPGAQALVEGIERHEGIRTNPTAPLEERWNAVMHNAPAHFALAA